MPDVEIDVNPQINNTVEIEIITDEQILSDIETFPLYGPRGQKGDKGEQGIQGETGQTGATGNGISSISKTATAGLVDTYTILYTNTNTDTFTVTNGEDGEDGQNGQDGFSPIATVTKSGGVSTLTVTDKNGTTTTQILDGTGAITDVQVNSTSVVTSGVANISISAVGLSNSYNDLDNKPTIPAAQVQADWNEADTGAADYIKNKPTIPTVPTALSSFTDDLGSSPTHTHSQYLTSHQDISGKADKSVETIQNIVTVTGGTVNLVSDKVLYSSTPTGSTTYTFTLPSGTVTGTQAFTFELYVNMSTTAYSLTFPNSVTWQGGTAPDMSSTGKYFLAFRTMDGGTTWLGNLQGVW